MIETIQAAAAVPLIPLEEVRQRIGVAVADAPELERHLTDACAAIEAYLGQGSLGLARYRELRAGNGTQHLALDRQRVEVGSVVVKSDGAELTDFYLVDDGRCLFRSLGWPDRDGAPYLEITYSAGWLLPDQVSTWSASATVQAGAWVRPRASHHLRFEVESAGTLGAVEPSWPNTVGAAVAIVGVATLKARSVAELPSHLRSVAYVEAWARWAAREVEPNLIEESADGWKERYAEPKPENFGLHPNARAALDLWRVAR